MKERNSDFELDFFERLVEQNPDFVDALVPLAEAYTRRGFYDKGLEVDKKLSRLRKFDPVVHYNLACSYALVGKKKEAFESLNHAVHLGYRDFDHLKRDSDLKCLHGDPRFVALLQKFPSL